MKARPVLESIKPHDGVGGCVPTPRNDKVASIKIALPSQIEAMTRIGAVTLGRMWVMMIRGWRHPMACAASTYRFCFAESTAPRTMRELPGMITTAIAIIALFVFCLSTDTIALACSNHGVARTP